MNYVRCLISCVVAGLLCLVPALAEAQSVSAGASTTGYTTLAKPDGTAWIWGYTLKLPTAVSTSVSVTAVAAGGDHVVLLASDGTVWGWGGNTNGEVGDGSTTFRPRSSPVQVDNTGSTKTYTYDANGNLTSDGTRTFEWDARNQLVAVVLGAGRTEFNYDGMQRRVRVVEKEDSVVISVVDVVWCNFNMCERRSTNGAVMRRVFALGEQVNEDSQFYSANHLGTVSEVSDDNEAVMARYEYDPWGRRSLTYGNDVAALGFTGHEWLTGTSILLSMYRAYDPEIGRWMTEDPVRDGLNYYAYLSNNPINDVDPLGLFGFGDVWKTYRRWTSPYSYYKWITCTYERQKCVSAAWDACKERFPSSNAQDTYRCSVCFHRGAAVCDRQYFNCMI